MAAEHDPREKRARHLVEKHGLVLRKNRSKDKLHPSYGRFMILDLKQNRPVLGHVPHLYSLKLEEIEAWLERQDGA